MKPIQILLSSIRKGWKTISAIFSIKLPQRKYLPRPEEIFPRRTRMIKES